MLSNLSASVQNVTVFRIIKEGFFPMLSVHRLRLAARLCTALVFAAVLLSAPSAFAQGSDTAGLEVYVRDASGAILPGAKVHIEQQQENIVRDGVTDKQGEYRFTAIPSGDYVVTIEKEGFGQTVESGISLTVGQMATINVAVNAKESTQVNVTSATPIIDTDRSQIGQTISTEEIDNLPSANRNFLDFALTVPGIDSNTSSGQGSGFSANGGRQRSNSILIDGVENNGLLNGTVRQTVSIDSVKEFQVITNNFLPEYGQASGALINLVTKTGTEKFHGDVFYYYLDPDFNSRLCATYPRNNQQYCALSGTSRQDFGATLGGPLYKDKTFFFASGEYLGAKKYQLNGISSNTVSTVNTALGYGFVLGAGVSSVSNNNIYAPNPLTLGSFRVDHTMNERNTFIYRLLYAHYNNANPGIDIDDGTLSDYSNGGKDVLQAYSMMGEWTHIISPSLLNEMHVQFAPQKLTQYANSTGTTVHIASAIEFGPNPIYTSLLNETHYEFIDALSWTKGNHFFKFGTDLSYIRAYATLPTNYGGYWHFASLGTGQAWIPGYTGCGQNPTASTFGCGFPDEFHQGFGSSVIHMADKLVSFYAEDQWKVMPRFSLNYGLRYDIDLQPQGYNRNLADPIQANQPKGIPRDYLNFSPRVGFAWSLDKSGNTVIRGGYGIFYDRIFLILSRDALLSSVQLDETFPTICGAQMKAQWQGGPYPQSYNFPATNNFSATTSYGNITTTTCPNQGGAPLIKESVDSIDKHLPIPMSQQVNLFLDRALAPNWELEVGGLFVAGIHLVRANNTNLQPPVIFTPANQVALVGPFYAPPAQYYGRAFYTGARTNPNFNNITTYGSHGHSTYAALRSSLVHRATRSLTLRASYIWSKTLDDSEDFTTGSEPTNAYEPQQEKAVSVQDQRNHFIGSAVYHFPYQMHHHNNSALRWIGGGWVGSAIYNAGSGQPANPVTDEDNNGDGEDNDRPFIDLVNQPAMTLGHVIAGRNSLRGFRQASTTLRLQKEFFVPGGRLTLSAESFNAFNQVTFNSVYTDWGGGSNANSAYGNPQGVNSGRSFQLGIKYQF